MRPTDNKYALAACGVLLAGFLVGLGCDAEDPQSNAAATTTGGSQGGSTSSSSSNAASSGAAETVASTTASTGSTRGQPCDPMPGADEFYALSDTPAFPPTTAVSMCDYRGEVVLVVNTAAL